MFTLPPRPPKDYDLREYSKLHRSGDEFDPAAGPRVTQKNFGIFSQPVQYDDNEVPDIKYEPTNQQLLDRWSNIERAWWVYKPGFNDKFVHEVFHKYSVVVDSGYDDRFKHKQQVFNRPFQYEFDCLELTRKQKLCEKMKRDQTKFESAYQKLVEEQIKRETPKITVKTCKEEPPFWWQTENVPKTETKTLKTVAEETTSDVKKYPRWQDEPTLVPTEEVDFCNRKYDLLLFNQPFRSEACNWYYENYPPPKIKFRPEKFG